MHTFLYKNIICKSMYMIYLEAIPVTSVILKDSCRHFIFTHADEGITLECSTEPQILCTHLPYPCVLEVMLKLREPVSVFCCLCCHFHLPRSCSVDLHGPKSTQRRKMLLSCLCTTVTHIQITEVLVFCDTA